MVDDAKLPPSQFFPLVVVDGVQFPLLEIIRHPVPVLKMPPFMDWPFFANLFLGPS